MVSFTLFAIVTGLLILPGLGLNENYQIELQLVTRANYRKLGSQIKKDLVDAIDASAPPDSDIIKTYIEDTRFSKNIHDNLRGAFSHNPNDTPDFVAQMDMVDQINSDRRQKILRKPGGPLKDAQERAKSKDWHNTHGHQLDQVHVDILLECKKTKGELTDDEFAEYEEFVRGSHTKGIHDNISNQFHEGGIPGGEVAAWLQHKKWLNGEVAMPLKLKPEDQVALLDHAQNSKLPDPGRDNLLNGDLQEPHFKPFHDEIKRRMVEVKKDMLKTNVFGTHEAVMEHRYHQAHNTGTVDPSHLTHQ